MAPVGFALDTAMNVAKGFTDISFYYASPEDVVAGVQVWSGFNGTGTLLATFNLTKNSDPAGSANPYGTWHKLSSGSWSEIAHSATFFNSVGFGAFDEISISSPVPEPSTASLALMGLAGLALMRHRISRKG